jgi:hypothetical protein
MNPLKSIGKFGPKLKGISLKPPQKEMTSFMSKARIAAKPMGLNKLSMSLKEFARLIIQK